MHISHRPHLFPILAVILLAIIPIAAGAQVLNGENSVHEAFDEVLDQAEEAAEEQARLSSQETQSKRVMSQTEKKLLELSRKRRELRMDLAGQRSRLSDIQQDFEHAIQDERTAGILLGRERDRLLTFLRRSHARSEVARGGSSRVARTFIRRVFIQSLGESVEEGLADTAINRARSQLIEELQAAQQNAKVEQERLHASAGSLTDAAVPLEEELNGVRAEYFRQLEIYDQAEKIVELSAEQLEEVQRESAEVHQQVLRLQASLVRIEQRLQREAERDLIEKGLMDPRPGIHSDGRIVSTGFLSFLWPAVGTISAGYGDSRYARIFHVPHRGIDIVVPQETPIYAAARGVVFVAKDGGRGYSYLLIAHGGGYATLYGHLTSFSVAQGQEVQQGQLIGTSGGRPGTPGAGVMTTGPHLHFEVFLQGEHVDPASVLP